MAQNRVFVAFTKVTPVNVQRVLRVPHYYARVLNVCGFQKVLLRLEDLFCQFSLEVVVFLQKTARKQGILVFLGKFPLNILVGAVVLKTHTDVFLAFQANEGSSTRNIWFVGQLLDFVLQFYYLVLNILSVLPLLRDKFAENRFFFISGDLLLQVYLTLLDFQLHHLYVVRKDNKGLDSIYLIYSCRSKVYSYLVQKFVA